MPHEISGPGSIDRRPDAISSNYLFAHSWGPVQLGDFSQGLYNRPWRVRADNDTKKFYLARANDANTAWEAETEVFTFVGADIIEMDACFDQQGRVFVCAERATGAGGASEIWAYFLDPFVPGYVFVQKATGRTPRCILDDVVDTALGDVLMFYVNPVNGVCWRQQRDRYNIETLMVFGNIATTPLIFTQPYGPGGSAYGTFPQNGFRAYTGFFGPPFLFNNHHIRGSDPAGGTVASDVTIAFNRPIAGVSFDVVDAIWPDGFIQAKNAAGAVIGSLSFPAGPGTYSLYVPGIRKLSFNPSAADYTSFDNIFIAPEEDVYVPPPPSAMYLEDVFKAGDGRVHLLYSVRDQVTGRYQLLHYESLLYPIYQFGEGKLTLLGTFGDLNTLRLTLITFDSTGTYFGSYPQLGETALGLVGSLNPAGGEIPDVLTTIDLFDKEAATLVGSIVTEIGSLIAGSAINDHVLYDKDGLQLVGSFGAGGTLVVILIIHILYDHDDLTLAGSFGAGGTLV
jgi:hypothetical protein